MYERSTPLIKMKKDLFTMKEVLVKVQKSMIFRMYFHKYLGLNEHRDNNFCKVVCIWNFQLCGTLDIPSSDIGF